MTFAEPRWFWALLLLVLLVACFLRNEAARRKVLQQLVAARLEDRLAGSVSNGKRRVRFALLLLGLACIVVSLARPQRGYTWQETQRRGRDVLIAIDTSRSMLATDLAPNRLTRARLAAQDLISQLTGDRVGLIAFAGGAFLQAPLTIDYTAVVGALQELDTEIIPRGGTNIAGAIAAAVDAFGKGESDHRALIIFTDGEELDADGVKAAAEQNGSVRIFTVGLGSPDGSLIPITGPGGGSDFVRDQGGNIVKSRLDEEKLQAIAEASGGFYLHLQNGRPEMKQLVENGLGTMTEKDIDARVSRQPIERYQWPLSAGLVLLAASWLLSERKRIRKTAAPAAAVVALLFPSSAEALNNGLAAYEREDYKAAQEEFSRQLQRSLI
jgi:Ca-activated chloride channel family protein